MNLTKFVPGLNINVILRVGLSILPCLGLVLLVTETSNIGLGHQEL